MVGCARVPSPVWVARGAPGVRCLPGIRCPGPSSMTCVWRVCSRCRLRFGAHCVSASLVWLGKGQLFSSAPKAARLVCGSQPGARACWAPPHSRDWHAYASGAMVCARDYLCPAGCVVLRSALRWSLLFMHVRAARCARGVTPFARLGACIGSSVVQCGAQCGVS